MEGVQREGKYGIEGTVVVTRIRLEEVGSELAC